MKLSNYELIHNLEIFAEFLRETRFSIHPSLHLKQYLAFIRAAEKPKSFTTVFKSRNEINSNGGLLRSDSLLFRNAQM